MDIPQIVSTLSQVDWLAVLGAISGIAVGLIVIFEFIPGEQPEKFLRSVVSLIARFSRK
jgi:hypothetical protein